MKRSTLPLVFARYGRHSRGTEAWRCAKSRKVPIVPVEARSVAIPIGHYGAHVVVQHLARHSTEEVERALVTAEQRLQPLIGDELDVSRPAPSQCRDEHHEPVAPAADGREVALHLAPWFGLEPDQRLPLGHGSQRREVILQDAVPARTAERPTSRSSTVAGIQSGAAAFTLSSMYCL
jgi:hypothetical protein